MKQFLKTLDIAGLFTIPVVCIMVIFYLPNLSEWKILFIIDLVVIFIWMIQWIRFHHLTILWENMVYQYYLVWDRESEPPNDTLIIDETTRKLVPTFTNVFLKKKDISAYIEDKLFLFHIEQTIDSLTIKQ
jgi:hypothetical protein